MARKVLTYTVTDEGRDRGKAFVLTEMPAAKAERWAMRALQGLIKAGVEMPDEASAAGVQGLAIFGFRAFGAMDFDVAEPLLDEMMTCVTCLPDPTRPQVVRNLIEDDIEEVVTRVKLRLEIFKLHVNFSKADAA